MYPINKVAHHVARTQTYQIFIRLLILQTPRNLKLCLRKAQITSSLAKQRFYFRKASNESLYSVLITLCN